MDRDPLVRPIRAFHSGGRYLVWKPKDIHALRVRHRIVGTLVGALPAHKGQAVEKGAPLSMSFEETLAASEAGIIEVVDTDSADPPSEPQLVRPDDGESSEGGNAALQVLEGKCAGFMNLATECTEWLQAPLPVIPPSEWRLARPDRMLHARVFSTLWALGYFLTTGFKFGGDFLCYGEDPMSCHAIAIVHVLTPERPELRRVERSCFGRLATAARKLAILVSINADGELRFQALDPLHEIVEYDIVKLRDWDIDNWRRRTAIGPLAVKRDRKGEPRTLMQEGEE
jgi:tRNA-splicing endonuclease subunit Sen34